MAVISNGGNDRLDHWGFTRSYVQCIIYLGGYPGIPYDSMVVWGTTVLDHDIRCCKLHKREPRSFQSLSFLVREDHSKSFRIIPHVWFFVPTPIQCNAGRTGTTWNIDMDLICIFEEPWRKIAPLRAILAPLSRGVNWSTGSALRGLWLRWDWVARALGDIQKSAALVSRVPCGWILLVLSPNVTAKCQWCPCWLDPCWIRIIRRVHWSDLKRRGWSNAVGGYFLDPRLVKCHERFSGLFSFWTGAGSSQQKTGWILAGNLLNTCRTLRASISFGTYLCAQCAEERFWGFLLWRDMKLTAEISVYIICVM